MHISRVHWKRFLFFYIENSVILADHQFLCDKGSPFPYGPLVSLRPLWGYFEFFRSLAIHLRQQLRGLLRVWLHTAANGWKSIQRILAQIRDSQWGGAKLWGRSPVTSLRPNPWFSMGRSEAPRVKPCHESAPKSAILNGAERSSEGEALSQICAQIRDYQGSDSHLVTFTW